MSIREISPEDTYSIRHQVLWSHKSIEFVKINEDTEGVHYGLFEFDTLVSVISLFYNENEVQFRKFATLRGYQGRGLGSALLRFVFQEAKNKGVQRIWCNARVTKKDFYTRFGMVETETVFTKEDVAYVVMECVFYSV